MINNNIASWVALEREFAILFLFFVYFYFVLNYVTLREFLSLVVICFH
jgi:hypothetical protein